MFYYIRYKKLTKQITLDEGCFTLPERPTGSLKHKGIFMENKMIFPENKGALPKVHGIVKYSNLVK